MPKELVADEHIWDYCGLDPFPGLYINLKKETFPVPVRDGAAFVHNIDEYQQLKKHLFPDASVDIERLRGLTLKRSHGQIILWALFRGFFWYPRMLFGIEGHLYSFYDQPELMHTVNADLLEFNLRTLDKVCDVCVPDIVTLIEDMSYNHGPMLSKKCFDEFLAPYYRKFVAELKKRGITSTVDSDGNVHELTPWLEEVGIEGIHPLERRAANDITKFRQDHPKFKLIGGFDKTVMHLGEGAIRKEFERIFPVMCNGGFIPSIDHQTPPSVSIDDYRLYVSLLKEYCQKAAVCNTAQLL